MDGLHAEDTASFEDAGLTRVVAGCERFEASWRDGGAPRIEDFLEAVAPALRERLLRELLAIEVELRSGRGESPTPEDYLHHHPEWAAAIADVFSRETFASPSSEPASPPTAILDGSPDRADAGRPSGSEMVDTVDQGRAGHRPPPPAEPLPERLGRYAILSLVRTGGFGRVLLGRDEELGRPVAIKILHPTALRDPGQVDSFLAEARLAAGLAHPGIVRVYDVGRFGEGDVFVVFEFVEGRDLASILEEGRPAPATLAALMARVAEAAHHAHSAGLVHRDLKPANILVDAQGTPLIADFGLAVHQDLQHLLAGQIAGTPAFMAPEQVRGETHRLDRRTDVWALGVILYLGLTGRLPFPGRIRDGVFHAIAAVEPKPPRQLDGSIPRELERVCLKCLAKRMSDRYDSAAELAEDLRTWLAQEGGATATAAGQPGAAGLAAAPSWRTTPILRSAPIVPRGLRAFDPEDADFFPRLIPGPRDRDGLPESIRAWRRRIEEPDPDRSFPVGLIYGPSGSGKSSFVRAGLIPRLARWIRPVYVDADAGGTEARLLAALHREFPGLPAACGLAEAAAALREGRLARGGSRVLVVLDQFEQWLHAHPDSTDGELVRALRQCDGAGLQALLLVRDDFWMAVTRFLRVLEVRPVEGYNSSAVEPFDARHAARVLAELGLALGRLPEPVGPEGARFLEQAVKELAGPDGRIIPVRLTLLAEMLRHRDWTPATLRELGGFEGIGVMFLEETFCAPGAPPSLRAHQAAAQAVLKALLPEPSSDLKGRMRPASALREAAGYADRPADFDKLMTLLDNELRMVTPVDPSARENTETDSPPTIEASYQLAHDYLVPSLRQWLTRKQRETRRGRAELRLATITAIWRERPESHRLPSLLEWLMIVGLTRPRGWSDDERRLMRAATRRLLLQAATVALGVGVLARSIHAVRERERARGLLAAAVGADYQHLADQLPELDAHRDALRPALLAMESDPKSPGRRRDVSRILLFRDRPTAGLGSALRGRLTSAQAQPEEVAAIRDALKAHPAEAGANELVKILGDESSDPAARLRAACALRALEPGFADGPGLKAAAPALADALLAEHGRSSSRWLALLGPAAEALVPPLGAICADPGRDISTQAAAADALAELLGRRHRDLALARIITEATPAACQVLLRETAGRGLSGEARDFLRSILDKVAEGPRTGERPEERIARQDRLAERRAAAAVALAALGEPDRLWSLLRHRPDPRVRSMLIQRLAGGALPARTLVDRLNLSDLDPIEAQALLLAGAESRREGVPPPARLAIVAAARDLYTTHRHPGVHAAAELLLRRWGEAEILRRADDRPAAPHVGPDGLGWVRGPNGHTFAIIPAPLEFRMGSPGDEPGHLIDQVLHYRRIGRSLAVSMTEVTLEQFRRLDNEAPQIPDDGAETGRPAHDVDWFRAVRYCNRLSREAGIRESQWCYPEPDVNGLVVPADAVDKEGFRLPTEAEWEYICRAGTETARYFGESMSLLPRHAWTWMNSDERVHPVGQLLPNEFGLFDVLGNVWEWCQDGPAGCYPDTPIPPYPRGTREHPDPDAGHREVVLYNAGKAETWRILRGGASTRSPTLARSAHRDWLGSLERWPTVGFRVVRTLASPPRPGD